METGTTVDEIKEYLLQSNEEFRRLAQEHTDYDTQLERLVHKNFLSDDEQLQEVTLKKKKLHVKDQMEIMIQKHRHQVAKQSGPTK